MTTENDAGGGPAVIDLNSEDYGANAAGLPLPPPSVSLRHRDSTRYPPIRFKAAVRTISAPAVEGIVYSLPLRRQLQHQIVRGRSPHSIRPHHRPPLQRY